MTSSQYWNELEELIFKHQAGDSYALGDIFTKMQGRINGIISNKERGLPPEVHRMDIETGIFDGVAYVAKTWTPEKILRVYMNSMIDNKMITWFRKMFPMRKIDVTNFTSISEGDEGEFLQAPYKAEEEREHLLQGITKIFEGLSERDKKLVYCRYGKWMRAEDIGGIIGKSKPRTCFYLREEIRPLLKQRFDELDIVIPGNEWGISQTIREVYDVSHAA